MNIKELISEEKIKNRIKQVAEVIQKDFNNEEIILICVLKGATFFSTELAKDITSPIILDFIKVSSYKGSESTGVIHFDLNISEEIKDKNVLIVEDIIDTGRTLT